MALCPPTSRQGVKEGVLTAPDVLAVENRKVSMTG